MERLLCSIKEAALCLGVCPRTIYNLIASHELTARKIGRRTMIPRQSLEQFVRHDHRTQQPPELKAERH